MNEHHVDLALDVSAVPARPAGAGRYVVELVRALADRDDVSLRLLARRDDTTRWPVSPRTETIGCAPSSLPGRLVFGEIGLARVAASGHPSAVLHGPHYTLPAATSLASVVTVHDLTLLDHPEWHERTKVVFFRRALHLVPRRADVVVVPSEFVAAQVRERLSGSVPVVAIPHGVDHERFVPAPRGDGAEGAEGGAGSDEAVLARHGIEWPYVVNVATREPRKNLPALVAAFARVAASRRDLRLVLAGGQGWGDDGLDAVIAGSGCAERIVSLGYVGDGDVPALLRRASAVAYPSFAEGFGLPALEAMACGAPLVTSAASAMAEVTGEAALLVDPTDVGGLADCLEELVEGGQAVEERRALGIETAAGYTWARSASAHLEAYRLARSRSGGHRRGRRA